MHARQRYQILHEKMNRIQALMGTVKDADVGQKATDDMKTVLAWSPSDHRGMSWEGAMALMVEEVKKADTLLAYVTQKAPGLRREFEREVEAETIDCPKDFSAYEPPKAAPKPKKEKIEEGEKEAAAP
jgi:hypothetical protein